MISFFLLPLDSRHVRFSFVLRRFPAYYHLWIVAILVYVNFFTHHFFYDSRYLLFAYLFVFFFKTKVYFKVYHKERSMPLLVGATLIPEFRARHHHLPQQTYGVKYDIMGTC